MRRPNHNETLRAKTLWNLLEKRVDRSPDLVLLSDEWGRSLTCAQFAAKAERVAAGLASLGIGSGTAVTWQLPTRIETVVLSFALARLGAVQNPIIPLYRQREVGYCIRDTAASFVFTAGVRRGVDHHAVVEAATADLNPRPELIDGYDDLPEADPTVLGPPPSDGDEVRWIYYTSGTTAAPKGARHTDATLIAGGVGLAEALDVGPGDVGSIAFPYAHIGGPDYLVMLLSRGLGAVLVERFDPATAIPLFASRNVTIVGGSTAFYQLILRRDQELGGGSLPSLRLMAGGGAPMPATVFHEVKRAMGVPIVHGYGMTECPMICQGTPADSDDQLANTEGAPIADCEVSIVRSDETEAAPGEEGEIRVAGPMVFRGYTDSSLDRDAFDARGRFRTGDLGVRSDDGHIAVTGRVKDIIIRKGENVSAREIEDVLHALPEVAEVAVIGLPDDERGERVCAVVHLSAGHSGLAFETMARACRDAGLMRQKVPEQLEISDEPLPRNATMKVLKDELRARYRAGGDSPGA